MHIWSTWLLPPWCLGRVVVRVCGYSHCDLDWQVRACPWSVGFQVFPVLQCWRPAKKEKSLTLRGGQCYTPYLTQSVLRGYYGIEYQFSFTYLGQLWLCIAVVDAFHLGYLGENHKTSSKSAYLIYTDQQVGNIEKLPSLYNIHSSLSCIKVIAQIMALYPPLLGVY